MGNKVTYKQAKIFINLFHNRETKETKRKNQNPEKIGL